MLSDEFWKALRKISGDDLSSPQQKQLSELHAVECLLSTLYPDDSHLSCRIVSSDPPDIEFDSQSGVIGVEVVAVIHGAAREATKALRKGKSVPGYLHSPEIPPEQQRFVWKTSKPEFTHAVHAHIVKKTKDLARWPQNKFSERWLLVAIDPNDHNAEIAEIENWLLRMEHVENGFDRVFALTSDYDLHLRRPRAIEIGLV